MNNTSLVIALTTTKASLGSIVKGEEDLQKVNRTPKNITSSERRTAKALLYALMKRSVAIIDKINNMECN